MSLMPILNQTYLKFFVEFGESDKLGPLAKGAKFGEEEKNRIN